MTILRFRQLVVSLLTRRPGLDFRPENVGFVVGKLTVGRALLGVVEV